MTVVRYYAASHQYVETSLLRQVRVRSRCEGNNYFNTTSYYPCFLVWACFLLLVRDWVGLGVEICDTCDGSCCVGCLRVVGWRDIRMSKYVSPRPYHKVPFVKSALYFGYNLTCANVVYIYNRLPHTGGALAGFHVIQIKEGLHINTFRAVAIRACRGSVFVAFTITSRLSLSGYHRPRKGIVPKQKECLTGLPPQQAYLTLLSLFAARWSLR